jgi:hypothetical protein
VDKFLGLNESADGETELKMGEASKIENFYITDNYNLQSRDGVAKVTQLYGKIMRITAGNIEGKPWFMAVSMKESVLTASVRYIAEDGTDGEIQITASNVSASHPVKVFPFGENICVVARNADSPMPVILQLTIEDGMPKLTRQQAVYVPLTVTGAAPAGGGTAMDAVNLLGNDFRMQYSADGETKSYQLPASAGAVTKVLVDNAAASGSYDGEKHIYTFAQTPAKGVNNVEFFCVLAEDADIRAAREKFFRMKHSEAYNGATDTRTFFYGDGTNVCYYTGISAFGDGLYLPAGNEIAVDTSASPITAMARNYSSLIGFQTDGAFVISYEPITLADSTVTAGFYMRTASREFGNEMDGQVQTVNNYLRTLSGGSLYEWRYTSTQYRDERYAKRISEKVSRTLAKADATKVVTCDDNTTHTYYMFLNDEEGTVLINRYDIEVWTMYKGNVLNGVEHATVYDGKVLFCNSSVIFRFDADTSYDAQTNGNYEPVKAVWESGFLSFGADYKRKYSSRLWISLLPQSASDLEVTVQTDKRDDYLKKTIGYFLTDFTRVDFSNFSFQTWWAPMIKRIQIKVKKFVYYKLILRVTKPGARATVLGYDQQVRYSSNVK